MKTNEEKEIKNYANKLSVVFGFNKNFSEFNKLTQHINEDKQRKTK